ncbi:pentapeptide repeat-containing protein [Sorangium sp. So ce726]|uniref:pentapeptide repeat-containing protein n=1 Tax=Sorangium sp. So ce726 TaxID=3133319 RepID=UPI003F5E0CDE
MRAPACTSENDGRWSAERQRIRIRFDSMIRQVFGATRFNAPGNFTGLDFSPDSKTLVALVTGEKRTKVHRFAVDDGRALDEQTVTGCFTGVFALPDGDLLLWARGSIARLGQDGELSWKLGEKATKEFAFATVSADGASVATYGGDSVANVFDARTGKRLHDLSEPAGEIFAFAFSPDGATFATGGQKGIVRVFDRKSKKELAQRKSSKILALAFSPEGSVLAGGHGQGDVHLWDGASLEPVRLLGSHRFQEDYGSGEQDAGPAGCRWLAFLADGKTVVSQGNDRYFRWWKRSGAEIRRVRTPRHHAYGQGPAMALSRDGKWLAAGSTASGIGIWTSDGEPASSELGINAPHAIALGRERVVVAGSSGIWSWRRTDGTVSERRARGTAALANLPQGELLIVEPENAVVVREITDKSEAIFANDAISPQGVVAVSRDGKTVMLPVGSNVELWDRARGVRAATLSHDAKVSACTFGSDDTWAVSVSDAVRIWRLDDPETPVHTIELESGAPEYCGGVAVSRVGWIAVSIDRVISNHSSDSALVFIDPRSGEVTATLSHPDKRLGQVAFMDDARAVVVDSAGRTRTADAEKGKWLDEPEAPEDVEFHGFEILPLTASEDGTEIAHIDGHGNLAIRTIEGTKERVAPFDLGFTPLAEKKPQGMFEERLAGSCILYAGKFQSSAMDVRTSREFREDMLLELGGAVAKKAKDATHFVGARIPYAKHVPSKAETEIDARIAKGDKVIKLSEKKLIEMLLPTFEESRAMLRGEVKDGIERWNRWRSRWRTLSGGFVQLSGIDLTGADLRKADLMVIPFEEAKLSNARLEGVDLYDCVFRRADLRGADLEGARCGRVVFSNADLREAKLAGAAFSGAEFDGADLRGADLRDADLQYAKLTGAKLDGAKLDGAKLPQGSKRP